MSEAKGEWANKLCHRMVGGLMHVERGEMAISCLGPQCALWQERVMQGQDGKQIPIGMCGDNAVAIDQNRVANTLSQVLGLMIQREQRVAVPMDMNIIKGGRH